MVKSVFTESFRLAATRLGGAGELALYLCVPAAAVEDWLAGATRPPAGIFLRVVDLITSRSGNDPYAHP